MDTSKGQNSGRACLFGPEAATSAEHFIPSAIGGTQKPRILCVHHNGVVERVCDKPLIESLAFFIHALRVLKDRSNRGEDRHGRSVEATNAAGKAMVIDSSFNATPKKKTEILERDEAGRPTRFTAESVASAQRLLEQMGVDPASVPIEQISEPAGVMHHGLALDERKLLPGILKIAYEYVRGYLSAPAADEASVRGIHDILLNGAEPSTHVRWLPFRMLPEGAEAPFYSHRLCAWQNDRETLVIVELFNCLPFVARLPGVDLAEPALFIQGLQGEPVLIGRMLPPSWTFDDVPTDGLVEVMPEFQKRVRIIVGGMQMIIDATAVARFTKQRFEENPNVSGDEAFEFILFDLTHASGGNFERDTDALRNLIIAFLNVLRENTIGPATEG